MAKSKKSWESRLAGEPDKLAVDFVQSVSVDRRLYKYDIAGSIAHAQMLAAQKLITSSEFVRIKKGLLEIEQEITAGKFKFDRELEDIHMAIEAALIKRIGEAGEKLHTARSRNDQVATDVRLWMRDEIEILQSKLRTLQNALVKLAGKYASDVMAVYTHMQRAQPAVIGAYLLSFVEQFERDFIRLGNCRKLVDVCPLGSGAIAGSTLSINRRLTARLLGFSAVSRNSIDSVSDRDFCAEFIFDCSLIATHLSKLAEDWIIYSSGEFRFVKIDDAFCTSSSMMPQKRNPDVLELIRAKAGGVYGALMAMLTILKAQPSGYNRDLQEDKVHIFAAADSIEASLDVAAAVVKHTKFNTKKITASLDKGFLDATSIAEYLVGRGVAFRQAHKIVGQLVKKCEKQGKSLGQLSIEEFKKHCTLVEPDVYDWLGADNVIKKYVSEGAAGAGQTKAQIRFWQKKLAR